MDCTTQNFLNDLPDNSKKFRAKITFTGIDPAKASYEPNTYEKTLKELENTIRELFPELEAQGISELNTGKYLSVAYGTGCKSQWKRVSTLPIIQKLTHASLRP
jgi:hypothetical protein